MQAISIERPTADNQTANGRASFFPALYGAVIAAALLFGGMAGVMVGDSATGETPPEAVAFVDAAE